MDFIGLITEHGYLIALAVAFVDQFGTPVPAIAILLAGVGCQKERAEASHQWPSAPATRLVEHGVSS